MLSAVPVLILTSCIVFMLMRLLPGDPVLLLLGQAQAEVSAEDIARIRHDYQLDRPVYIQYVAWAEHTLSGDLGRSMQSGQPVWSVMQPRILPTAQIGLFALLLAVLIGVPLGAVSGRMPGSWQDWLGTALALGGAAMPYFLAGGLLIYFVGLRWGLLPSSGYVSPFDDPMASLRSTVLPAITLSLGFGAVITRQTRSSFADVLRLPFIRTARAKGLSEAGVMLHHALQNAMLPVVTILGVQLGAIFSGAVVTETVFAIPGLGRLLVDSILSRDYAVVQAVVLFITVAVVLVNLAVDILCGLLDPRTRQGA